MNGTVYGLLFPNDRNYVGQSKVVTERLRKHQYMCKMGTHPNPILEAHVRKYGFPKPVILATGIETQSELDRLETLWTWRLSAHESVGGLCIKFPGAGGSHNKKTREKMSGENHRYYGKRGDEVPAYGLKRSPETCKKLSDIAKGRTGSKNPFYGRKHTPESREKMRQSTLGQYQPKGKDSPLYGKKHTTETLRKMSITTRQNYAKKRGQLLLFED